MSRNKRIEVRLTENEYKIFERLAEYLGIGTMSTMIRLLILQEYRKKFESEEKRKN